MKVLFLCILLHSLSAFAGCWDSLVQFGLLQVAGWKVYGFDRNTKKPKEVQRRMLERLIRDGRDTLFGRDHGFKNIKSVADFQRAVPIGGYDSLAPYIDQVAEGNSEALFPQHNPVLMFAVTSGTTSARKLIPVTKLSLQNYRNGWLIWGLHYFKDHPELLFKPTLQFVGKVDEERRSGIPVGNISGLTAKMQNPVVKKTYVLPAQSADVEGAAKYYWALRIALMTSVYTVLSPNPSTLAKIAEVGQTYQYELVKDIYDGTVSSAFAVPEHVVAASATRLKPNPQRARELEKIIEKAGGHLVLKDAWPNLGGMGCWTGGSAGSYLPMLEPHFGKPAIRDLGLLASEGRMTIPVEDYEDGGSGGVLDINSTFYEFIPVGEENSARPTVVEAQDLIEGREYFILLTNASGLYRYNIGDVVRCEGFHHKTPVVSFLNKGSQFSNITGEKISEHQVNAAVTQSMRELSMTTSTFALAPVWESNIPHYGLFMEREFGLRALAELVEKKLGVLNIEYRSKRDSGRLGPIQIYYLKPGAWREWDENRRAVRGGSDAQYKHPNLIPDVGFYKSISNSNQLIPTGS